jgi:membrane-bound metal-dependent hydrolase YbcI (DUF457 family)
MGKSHVTMGACTLCLAGAAHWLPWTAPRLAVVVIGLVLGGNVAPDIDHKKASVTRCWGYASRSLCWVMRLLARWMYLATRTTHDPRGRDPHRGFWHTSPGCVAIGLAVAIVCAYGHPWMATAMVAMATGAAGYAFDKGLRPYAATIGGVATWSLAPELAGHLVGPATLGVAMIAGCLTHCLMDCTTTMGNPWSFPRTKIIKVLRKDGSVIERRQRWHLSGPPEWMRYHTGKDVEKWIVRLAIVGTLVLSWYLFTL